MKRDAIDELKQDWNAQRPDLDPEAMGVVLRIQALAKILGGQAAECVESLGLKWWQYDVLSALRRQGEPYIMAAGELAEASMLTTGAMTHRIDRLADRGLVVREEDPEDRRRVLVRLSKPGFKLIEEASQARFDAADSALRGLTGSQRRQLARLLRLALLEQ